MLDRINELKELIYARKEGLRRKRVHESVIAKDEHLLKWQNKVERLIKELPYQPRSKTLETALKEFILENRGNDNLDRVLKKHLIDTALVMSYGNQSKASRILGIDRSSIRNYLGK